MVPALPVSVLNQIVCDDQVDKMDAESSQLQQELQDSKDQNELLEFRILELEVSPLSSLFILLFLFLLYCL